MTQVYGKMYYVILHPIIPRRKGKIVHKQPKILPRSELSSRGHKGKRGLPKYPSPVQDFDVNFIDSLTNLYHFSNQ